VARQRSDFGLGSLDLLLDTICNMFGGIVLMAILVVLQTQTSASRIPEPSDAEVSRSLEAQRLRFECERLEAYATDLDQHRNEVAKTFQATTSPTGERLADAQLAFRQAIDEARRRLQAAEAATTSESHDQDDREDLLRTADRSLQERQKEVADLEAALRQAQEAPTKSVRLSHRRGLADGEAAYYVIRADRVYALDPEGRFDWSGPAQRVGQCFMTPVVPGREALVTPIDGDGYPIRPEAGGTDAFLASLQHRPATTHYIVFFTYNDSASFATFQTVKDAIVNAHYRYAADPVIPKNGSFVGGPSSGHETE